MALNRARIPAGKDIGLTNGASGGNGFNYSVAIEYFDSAAPSTVLGSQTFTIPIGATTQQLQAVVVAYGQDLRTALAAQAAAQAAIPAGTTVITVP